MPQFLVLMLAGAGLYVGYKWVSREVGRAMDAAKDAHDELRRQRGETHGQPKDLGALEWDDAAQVYRPRKGR